MGSLKTLALAGAVFAGATAVASAADLGPPPLGLPPAPLAAPIAEASGWYLRGDVGIAAQKMKADLADRRFQPPSAPAQNYSQSKVAFAGIGAGYQFNSWLRADVTAEYRFQSRFQFLDTSCFGNVAGVGVATPGVSCGNRPGFTGIDNRNYYNGRISSTVFLANGYVDLGTWSGFTPFVGAGVGYAQHKITNLTDIGVGNNYFLGAYTGTSSSGLVNFADKSKGSFAWALMAGVAYDVSPNYKLEFGYRYLNMGKVTGQSLACANNTCGDFMNYRRIDAHEFRLGMRWMLGGTQHASAPMAYPVEPPHLIKKF